MIVNIVWRALRRALGAALIAAAVSAHAQVICRPSPRPSNPAPLQAKNCLMETLCEFGLNEESNRTLVLEKGKGYWFSASGCPKMGNIGLYVIAPNGEVLKQESSYTPAFCFTPKATGGYTIKVKANSLMRSYRSGTIDACFAESGCRDTADDSAVRVRSQVAISPSEQLQGRPAPVSATAAGNQPKTRAEVSLQTVGIIHIQNAILQTEDGQKAASYLDSKFAPKRKQIEQMQNQIQTLEQELRTGANNMSDDARQNLTREIAQRRKQVQGSMDAAQSELDAEQARLLQDLGRKIMAVIDKYARDNGLALILDVSNPQTPVLYASKAIDITSNVVAEYDNGALAPRTAAGTGSSPSVPGPADQNQIKVDGSVMQKKLVHAVRPVYPRVAKQARVHGMVRLQAVIARDGLVKEIQLISGHPLLVAPSVETVRQWRYEPTLLNGNPVEVITQIDVDYTLEPALQPPPAGESTDVPQAISQTQEQVRSCEPSEVKLKPKREGLWTPFVIEKEPDGRVSVTLQTGYIPSEVHEYLKQRGIPDSNSLRTQTTETLKDIAAAIEAVVRGNYTLEGQCLSNGFVSFVWNEKDGFEVGINDSSPAAKQYMMQPEPLRLAGPSLENRMVRTLSARR